MNFLSATKNEKNMSHDKHILGVRLALTSTGKGKPKRDKKIQCVYIIVVTRLTHMS